MSPRQPWSEGLDAELILTTPRVPVQLLCAYFKRTYRIQDGRLVRIPVEPLFNDPRDPGHDRLRIGASDFLRLKPRIDVVVHGSACSPRPVARMETLVTLGAAEKRIAVTGRREIHWREGRPRLGPPEPFTESPLTWQQAYGGIDHRVAVVPEGSTDITPDLLARAQHDHPGLYPRNPFGQGYLVAEGPVPGCFAPTCEDPSDLLTDERLLVRDPRLWWRQPLPWTYDFLPAACFPRIACFGPRADAWFPALDEELAEVRRGFIETGFRNRVLEENVLPNRRWLQGASHGLALEGIPKGEALIVQGMNPLGMAVYPLPDLVEPVQVCFDGKPVQAAARAQHLVARPGEALLNIVYALEVRTPRPYLPGIHTHIDITAQLSGEAPVAYQAPPTKRALLAAAKTKAGIP